MKLSYPTLFILQAFITAIGLIVIFAIIANYYRNLLKSTEFLILFYSLLAFLSAVIAYILDHLVERSMLINNST